MKRMVSDKSKQYSTQNDAPDKMGCYVFQQKQKRMRPGSVVYETEPFQKKSKGIKSAVNVKSVGKDDIVMQAFDKLKNEKQLNIVV